MRSKLLVRGTVPLSIKLKKLKKKHNILLDRDGGNKKNNLKNETTSESLDEHKKVALPERAGKIRSLEFEKTKQEKTYNKKKPQMRNSVRNLYWCWYKNRLRYLKSIQKEERNKLNDWRKRKQRNLLVLEMRFRERIFLATV